MLTQNLKGPLVIVFGNEKGGTGKSTLAMHAITHLLYEGLQVGCIDVDGRQGTLSRYIENRQRYVADKQSTIPIPEHRRITEANSTNTSLLEKALEELSFCDIVVIDSPGNDTILSRQAHSFADILFTPVNDSFVDLDVLVHVDEKDDKPNLTPSIYAEMVWEARKRKLVNHERPTEWIVVRNRLGHLFTKNKENVGQVLNELSGRIGFKYASGFGERVIFRELFLKGLTLLDLHESQEDLTFSHVAARQELRALMQLVPLPKVPLQKAS